MNVTGNKTKLVGVTAAAIGATIIGDTSTTYAEASRLGANVGLVLVALGLGFVFLRLAIHNATESLRQDIAYLKSAVLGTKPTHE